MSPTRSARPGPPAHLLPLALLLTACSVNPVPTPGDGALASSAQDAASTVADGGLTDASGGDDAGWATDAGGSADVGADKDAGTAPADGSGPLCTSTVDWSKNPATP